MPSAFTMTDRRSRSTLRLCLSVCLLTLAYTGFASADEKTLSIPAVVAKVRPSVVTILTRGMPAVPSQHGTQSGSGSGIIIDPTGYVLTNNHLVEGVKSLVVGLPTGRLTPGRVVARDFLLDLALVKINAQDLVPATLKQTASLEIGETVVAIGNPLALKGGSTVTVGVVSALDRSVLTPNGETLYDLIQTDAAINPGNSGGPLVDLAGEVVGINVAIAPSAQAISYAIALEAVYPHIHTMMMQGSVSRPDFGFTPVTVTPSIAASFGLDAERGILALNVDPSKLAGTAGLQTGDVITALDQHQLYNMGDFWHSVMREGDQPAIQFTIQGHGGQTLLTVPRPPGQKVSP
ncbi:MAG: trypsin-like peptidase domain-containing protein [Nitrospira sp.]|jgi:serine protease Do|nr:trypsin-like peptidase domain-containing protein [Nitrospira sp.]